MFSASQSAMSSSTVPIEGPEKTLENVFLPALHRVRKTAHDIEDRVRSSLLPHGAPVSTLRILIVDDVPDAADSLAVVLELIGCTVRACYDARTALRIASEFDPQVCLLDLVMPEMGGLELGACLRVAADGRPLVLIATTALGSDEMKSRTKIAGFDAHLTKPIDLPILIEAIADLWADAKRDHDSRPPSA